MTQQGSPNSHPSAHAPRVSSHGATRMYVQRGERGMCAAGKLTTLRQSRKQQLLHTRDPSVHGDTHEEHSCEYEMDGGQTD